MGIYGLTLVALACAGLVQQVAKSAGNDSAFSRSLRSVFLRRFGKYSYAIYVLHAPILAVAFHLYAKSPTPLRGCVLFLAGIVCSYIAGWVSWHLFESKILRLKRYFVYGQVEIHSKESVAVATG